MPKTRWCAATLVTMSFCICACSTAPPRAPYVPAVAAPPAKPLSRDDRIARAKALELPTAYVPPPGDPQTYHAGGLAKSVCSAVFISGFDPALAVELIGGLPAFEDRKALSAPVVDHDQRTVRVSASNGASRVARHVGGRQGCVTFNPGESSLHFNPSKVQSPLHSMATGPWPVGDRIVAAPPAEVDRVKLEKALALAFEPGDAHTLAFIVTWRGNIVAERYARGVTAQTPLESWSLGKTLGAALMGVLVRDGVYDLWDRVPVAEWRAAGDARSDIRLADLLRMSSGLRARGTLDPERYQDGVYQDGQYLFTGGIDTARYVISRPPQWLPGTVGRYRNSDTVPVSYLIRRAAEARGEDFYTFAERELLGKLGMRSIVMEPDAYGTPQLHGYVLGSARDWARFGNLLLNEGLWQGERLLPQSFVRFMRTPAPAWSADGRPSYGGSVWLSGSNVWPVPEDAYGLLGLGHQWVVVIPSHDLVVVRMGHVKGADAATAPGHKAIRLILEAVPQARAVQPAEIARP